MTRNKYIVIISIILVLALAFFFIRGGDKTNGKSVKEVNPFRGDITLTVTTTGVVEPQNRLEIKPSINGRIEEMLVNEGDKVKKGDILLYMSSTDRAALVDAARSKSDATLEYWEEVYKQSPIISPIDGEVIVRSVEPGQTATTADPLVVLSDRLIVKAQFDETDIGRVRVGQSAVIALDAYPDEEIPGIVDQIAYESELVNNVNIYDVDIVPQSIPEYFRSGMSANVEVVEEARKDILLIPVEAVTNEQGSAYVTVKKGLRNKTEKREVTIGLSDERNVEVISGLTAADIIVLQSQTYSPQKKQTGTNPFMPSHR
jgi:membrane fusion protein, macrolide-specific efflux system